MNDKIRIAAKLLLIIILGFLFIWLISKDKKEFQLKQPEGEYIEKEEAAVLLEAVEEKSGVSLDKGWRDETDEEKSNRKMLTYGEYLKIIDMLFEKKEIPEAEEKGLRKKLEYQNKYKAEFALLKTDWYQGFEQILEFYGLKKLIKAETIELLAGREQITGAKQVTEGAVLDKNGTVFSYRSPAFENEAFSTVKAYCMDDVLLTVIEETDKSYTLPNSWIMEADEKGFCFFYKGYEINYKWKSGEEKRKEIREQIGDISFGEGKLKALSVKSEKIGGKLLRIRDGELEIEGKGTYPLAENYKGYRLYEELVEIGLDSLAIGYDFADYVLEEGKICALLLVRKENMESIRIAIRDSGFKKLYHESVRLLSDVELELTYGKYGERKTELIPAGEELEIKKDSDYIKEDRLEVRPVIKTGKIKVLSLERNQGTPLYRGTLEIVKEKEGLLLINELLLEEYLYSVVPSEMPAAYPEEALKAQAVCARTYACRYLKSPGLPALSANVDDSVSYQVYNNIGENSNSTKAVKETTGIMLLHEDEPADTYYYSTSCGYGADAGVWKAENKEELPYLKSVHISTEEAEDMTDESNFREYILEKGEGDYEREEAWYRWQYQVEELNVEELSKRLNERFKAGEEKILTWRGLDKDYEKAESFEEKEPGKIKKVYNIQVLKRREGGVADQLLIETDKGIFKIETEYNIRYILNNGGEVKRQDESRVESAALLPSAYLVIDTVKKGRNVVGYNIFGGGCGHGVGMSQNGAKAMGAAGKDFEEIMAFFFEDCLIEKIY